MQAISVMRHQDSSRRPTILDNIAENRLDSITSRSTLNARSGEKHYPIVVATTTLLTDSFVTLPSQSSRSVAIAQLALLGVLVGGCGPTSDRLRIQGEVLLDGAPVERGSIRFSSMDDSSSLSAGAMIRDGSFDVPQERGLPPGTYRLSISSPDRDGPKVPYRAGPGQPAIMVTRDRVPVSYNVESEHTIELHAKGKNYFEFDIPTGG